VKYNTTPTTLRRWHRGAFISFVPSSLKRTEGHYTGRISLNNYCLLWFKMIESILASIFFSLLIFSIISRAFNSGFRFSKLNELLFQVG